MASILQRSTWRQISFCFLVANKEKGTLRCKVGLSRDALSATAKSAKNHLPPYGLGRRPRGMSSQRECDVLMFAIRERSLLACACAATSCFADNRAIQWSAALGVALISSKSGACHSGRARGSRITFPRPVPPGGGRTRPAPAYATELAPTTPSPNVKAKAKAVQSPSVRSD